MSPARVDAEVIATGLSVPEGPVVLGDGRVAFVEQTRGAVSIYDDGTVETIYQGPGALNAVTLGPDGALYGAQNGGVVGAWRAKARAEPGIERIDLAGTRSVVTTVIAGVGLRAPNDLVFGPDGRLYVTDPAEPYDPDRRAETNRIFAWDGSSGEVLIELPPSYTNGLVFGLDGSLFWAESYHRAVCMLDGASREVVCRLPDTHLPDGMACAADGTLYVATVTSHGITVLSPDGEIVDHLFLDDSALPTNCCFDGTTLWVTDFGVGFETSVTGRLWRVETGS
ncbi:MAG: SMP-30/gluconolactonase/LRE family protein [Acidimicrobiia bacterium]|jgi:gluconolactonase